MKLNSAEKGDEYFLMWTEAEVVALVTEFSKLATITGGRDM
jgi:hypothetical protein